MTSGRPAGASAPPATPPVPGTPRGTHAARAVDASMGLLNEVVYRPVEPGYALAAARPPATRSPRRRAARGAGHLVMAVVLGVVTVTAISSLRAPSVAVVESRTLLAERITTRSAEADALAAQNEGLSAEIGALQADALEAANPGLFAALEEAELLSGSLAVSGPGLVLTLTDAPGAGGVDEVDPESLVQDVDLQVVTNGLWAAGAEAIAINGQRLTALSAIRGAGQAILVDLAPITSPYEIRAVGDAQKLQTGFARTSGANHLALLTGTYDIGVSTRAEASLDLPGAGSATLRFASTPSVDAELSSSSPEKEVTP